MRLNALIFLMFSASKCSYCVLTFFETLSRKIKLYMKTDRGSHRCSVKKGAFRNFAKFTGKHLCQSFFYTKVFSCEFCKISKNTFFIEHLWATASALKKLWWSESLIFLWIGLQIFDPLYVLVSVARVSSRPFCMLQPIIDNATYVNNDIGYIFHVRDMVWFRSIITFNQEDVVIFVSQINTNGKIIQIHQTCTAG